MSSFHQDSSGNWKKSTSSSKKNYTIVDGKKVEKSEEKKSSGLSNSWQKDTVSLEEAKNQTSESREYMSTVHEQPSQPEQIQPAPTESTQTVSSPAESPTIVLTPEQNNKLNIAALQTNYVSGNGLEGSVVLTPNQTVKKQQQINTASNNYHLGILEPVAQKYESGAARVSDASYKTSKLITDSDKVASVTEGITSSIVNLPTGTARLAIGLVNNPVQTIADVPAGIVESFKENPYKASGEVVGAILTGAALGKGASAKLGKKPVTIAGEEASYTVLKGYETIKRDGELTNRIIKEDVPVSDSTVSHLNPNQVQKSILETEKSLPAKYSHTRITNGVATVEIGETLIKLTKPQKLSVNKTLFDDELVLGNGFEKHQSFKNPTYKRTIDYVDAPNGEDLITIITEENNANTIITRNTATDFQMEATIPKTEGVKYRTLYEFDSVTKESKAAALNGEDIVINRTTDYFKHSDEPIPLDNIESVRGKFIDKDILVPKETTGSHGNSLDISGMDSTPWKMNDLNNYESFKLYMENPVGEDILSGTISRSGKLPKGLDISEPPVFNPSKTIQLDGVSRYGSTLKDNVKVSGKSINSITPDIIKIPESKPVPLDDAIPQIKKQSRPYHELNSKKSHSIREPSVASPAIEPVQVPKAANRVSESQIIDYKKGTPARTIPAKPAVATGLIIGTAAAIASEFKPVQSITQIQYPLPKFDIRQVISPSSILDIRDAQEQTSRQQQRQYQFQIPKQSLKQDAILRQEPVQKPYEPVKESPIGRPTTRIRKPIIADVPTRRKNTSPFKASSIGIKKKTIHNSFGDITKLR